jgi:hypothetical protein
MSELDSHKRHHASDLRLSSAVIEASPPGPRAACSRASDPGHVGDGEVSMPAPPSSGHCATPICTPISLSHSLSTKALGDSVSQVDGFQPSVCPAAWGMQEGAEWSRVCENMTGSDPEHGCVCAADLPGSPCTRLQLLKGVTAEEKLCGTKGLGDCRVSVGSSHFSHSGGRWALLLRLAVGILPSALKSPLLSQTQGLP